MGDVHKVKQAASRCQNRRADSEAYGVKMDTDHGLLTSTLTASMSYLSGHGQASSSGMVGLGDSAARQDETCVSDRHSINDLLHHIISITDQSLDEAQAR